MSKYRGCKESEIIFGTFAENHLNLMNSRDQKEYEYILNFPDQDLLDWLVKDYTIPSGLENSDIAKKVKAFYKK